MKKDEQMQKAMNEFLDMCAGDLTVEISFRDLLTISTIIKEYCGSCCYDGDSKKCNDKCLVHGVRERVKKLAGGAAKDIPQCCEKKQAKKSKAKMTKKAKK